MQLFSHPKSIRRYANAPLKRERTEYLDYLESRGTSISRVRCLASTLLQVVTLLSLHELRGVGEQEILAAGERWASDTTLHASRAPGRNSKQVFVSAARQFLRFHRSYIPTVRQMPAFESEWLGYVDAMLHDRRLSASTVAPYRLRVRRFLRWYAIKGKTLRECSASDFDAYITMLRRERKPRTVIAELNALRSFFTYAAQQGWCGPILAKGLTGHRLPSCDPHKDPLPWETVQQLVNAQDGGHRADYRARAMMLLCSSYGLRSVEVCGLLLTQFNWRDGILRLIRSKNGRVQLFPITDELRASVSAYLAEVRPTCLCPNLFVTLSPPYRPVKPGVLSYMIARRGRKIGITAPRTTSHALRHAGASELLNAGTPLPRIAEFLGHSNTKTVSVYVKHTLASLEEVANIGLTEIL